MSYLYIILMALFSVITCTDKTKKNLFRCVYIFIFLNKKSILQSYWENVIKKLVGHQSL